MNSLHAWDIAELAAARHGINFDDAVDMVFDLNLQAQVIGEPLLDDQDQATMENVDFLLTSIAMLVEQKEALSND